MTLSRVSQVLWGRPRFLAGISKTLKLHSSRNLSSGVDESRYDIQSPFGQITPFSDNAAQLITKSCQKWGDRIALECGVTGQTLSYASLLDQMQRLGGLLQKGPPGGGSSVGPGDYVALLALNSPDYAVALSGIFASGAASSPINPTFTPNEVARQIADCNPKIFIVDPFLEDLAIAALSLLPSNIPQPFLYVMGQSKTGKPNLAQIIQDSSTPFAVDMKPGDDSNAVLAYSSGTTGLPKGAPTTQYAIKTNLAAVLHKDANLLTPASEDYQPTLMGLMPFFHAYGIYCVCFTGLVSGCKIVTLPKFEPATFIATIKKHQFELLHLVPPLLNFLLTPFITPEDLAPLRIAMCSAAPCSKEAALALKGKAPNPIFFQELYGMTETMPSMCTPRGQERIGSSGKLLGGFTARVVDINTEQPLPPGQKGELWIKGPSVMKGYHNKPEDTKEILRPDGWLKSGDIVTYDEDGFIYIVDRIKELIKVKGNQVSPSEIEQELMKHEGVADAGVVPVPDERAGEVPRAYVVLRDDEVTAGDLHDFLSTRLAKHKQLAGGIEFVDELPKSAAGKLLRRMLKEKAARG